MVTAKEVTAYFNRLVDIAVLPDDCSNNGLQVEGKAEVAKIMFAVDACAALFDLAAREHADYLFVHHGLSWGDNLRRLTGVHAARLRPLFCGGVSLYAAHLPLDAHQVLGHNAMIARLLGLRGVRPFAEYHGVKIGTIGELPQPLSVAELGVLATRALLDNVNAPAVAKIPGGLMVLADAPRRELDPRGEPVRTVAVIAGGAGYEGLAAAVAEKADVFVVGEFNHSCYHYAMETGIGVVAPGHYLTETPGVLEVMERTARELAVECVFAVLPTQL